MADLEGLRRNLLFALHGGARGREMLDDLGIEDAQGHLLGLAVLLPLLKKLDTPAITACGSRKLPRLLLIRSPPATSSQPCTQTCFGASIPADHSIAGQ